MKPEAVQDSVVHSPDPASGKPGEHEPLSTPSILLVHPSCELYGADRAFIQAVQALRARWPRARMTIVLPREGVLADILRQTEDDVRTEDLWIPRRASMASTVLKLPLLVSRIVSAARNMGRYDLTYINTLVVFDYLLASRFARGNRLIHVHEIVTGRERPIFGAILRWARGRFIFISQAVRDTFPELRGRDFEVIWNGVRDFRAAPRPADAKLRLLLIGRFNSWKGQDLLLDALSLLPREQRDRLSVRLVGSVFEGADYFLERIHSKIAEHGLGDCVEVHGFDPLPDAHYTWADVVIVPSIKPEPFGLVAIEAMSSGRAVIAADHGGLAEIVVNGETGLRVPPGDPGALAGAITTYLEDHQLTKAHGSAARLRYEQEFREEVHMQRIADAAAKALISKSR